MSDGLSAQSEQLAYYRAVADEYEEHMIDVPGQDELLLVAGRPPLRCRLLRLLDLPCA